MIANSAPYVFRFPPDLPDGSYAIHVDIFTGPDMTGEPGVGIDESYITVKNSPKLPTVVSFDIVDLHGNVLMPLAPGLKVNLKDPAFKSFSIRANTQPEKVANVAFFLNGKLTRVEGVPPYALSGDMDGMYNAWNPQPGAYTLSAVVSPDPDGAGQIGTSYEVQFTVVGNFISGFDVVDQSGRVLKTLSDGDSINIKDPSFRAFNIIAHATSDVQSVKFLLNDQFVRIENVVPFTLAGDLNGNFNALPVAAGLYELKATPYDEVQANGTEGESAVIHFQITERCPIAVTGFQLVDMSGRQLRNLKEDDVIDERDISIVATTVGPVGSVQFFLNGVWVRNENVVPYALAGDQNGLLNGWEPQHGRNTISAKPYLHPNASGKSCASTAITVYVHRKKTGWTHDEGSSSKLDIYPVPVDDELSVRSREEFSSKAILSIINAQGVTVHSQTFKSFTTVATGNLKPGVYYLRLSDERGIRQWATFVKK